MLDTKILQTVNERVVEVLNDINMRLECQIP